MERPGRKTACTTGGGNKCKGSDDVRPRPASVRRRRPLGSAPQRSGVRERRHLVREQLVPDRDEPTLGVSIAVTGSLKVQSLATDPVIELRVTGSQNQSIDCDPAISEPAGTRSTQGCGPAYKINPTLACPAYNELWSLPEPWECVKTQTGGAVGQVEQGMKDRILGGSNSCTAPINWPNYDPDDPRIVPLIITPFGSFGG